MKIFSNQRFLVIYSGVVTVIFAATVFAGFANAPARVSFDEVTVHRLNVVEPDGTPRLIVSNKVSFPGAYLHGKDIPRTDRDTAGMVFLNDEGTENGGLIFGGSKDARGIEHSNGHLSFDRYDQDQVMKIEQNQDGSQRASGISINDTGDYAITAQMVADADRMKALPAGQKKAAATQSFLARYPPYTNRAYFGRSQDKSVGLSLRDEQGRERLRISVRANGEPSIELLNEQGKVVDELTSERGRGR